ncbi:hypothetical protein pb186bvf_009793 [Paramecium bursaria]
MNHKKAASQPWIDYDEAGRRIHYKDVNLQKQTKTLIKEKSQRKPKLVITICGNQF